MTQRSKSRRSANPSSRLNVFRPSLLVLMILLSGFVLRCLFLDWKPVHFDEGINGNFVRDMWRDGLYVYNPENFHGPLYFYLLQLAELLGGPTIVAYRFANAVIALIGLYVLAAHRRFFGTAANWACAIFALSAGSLFYSRYAIHEILFVVCQIVFSFGYFLWLEERSRRALAWMSLGFFASIAVKETFFIFFGTWAIAIICAKLLARVRGEKREALALMEIEGENPDGLAGDLDDDANEPSFWRRKANANDVVIAISLGVWFLILIFTGGLLHQRGFHDLFAAFAVWTKTGTGHSGHEKPFLYWVDLLWRYEWPALLALLGALPALWMATFRERMVLLVAFGTWLAYSLIPYKTPWLILNFLWPLALTCGVILNILARHARVGLQRLAMITVAVAIFESLRVGIRINFIDYANNTEPYVYVQSTKQMKIALDYVFERMRAHPEDRNMTMLALVRDPWPLPWMLGFYPKLAYGSAQDAELAGSDVVLIDGADRGIIEKKLNKKYWRVPFQVRDAYEQGFAYLDFEKFKGIVPSDAEVVGETTPDGSGR